MNNKVATLHSSSPFSLMFGRASNPFIEYNEEASSTLTEEEMEKRWADLHEIEYPAIAKGVRRKQESPKLHFNAHHSLLPDLPVGSFVMVKPSVRSNKAQTQYEGPYKVARHTSGGTYTLRDLDGQLLPRNYAPEQIKPQQY